MRRAQALPVFVAEMGAIVVWPCLQVWSFVSHHLKLKRSSTPMAPSAMNPHESYHMVRIVRRAPRFVLPHALFLKPKVPTQRRFLLSALELCRLVRL